MASTHTKPLEDWEQLKRYLSGRRYATKVQIQQFLASCNITKGAGSVLSKLRRKLESVIYSRARGRYTMKPNGMELIGWLRGRKSTIASMLINSLGAINFYRTNRAAINAHLDPDNKAYLAALVAMLEKLLGHFNRLEKTLP